MSKLDMARGMSMDSGRERTQERPIPGRELSDAEILEMRLTLLQQQDMEKLKSSAELMKTLRDLHGLIKAATLSVQQSANAVKDYPAEVIKQSTARVEQSVKSCLEAAEKARHTYDAAVKLVSKVERQMGWWVLASSVLTSIGTAALISWVLIS